MVSCWDTAVLPYALLGCLLLTGYGSGSKLKVPELSLKGTQHVMQAGQTLFLKCRGEAAHSWSLPTTVSQEDKRLSITPPSACGRDNRQFCSTLTLDTAQANHTGLYTCRYLPTSTSKKKKAESSIYIFVSAYIKVLIKVDRKEQGSSEYILSPRGSHPAIHTSVRLVLLMSPHLRSELTKVEPVKAPRQVSSPLGHVDTDDDPVSLLGEEQ